MKMLEEFSAYSLNTLPGKYKSEEVLLYGIEPDSRYVTIDFNNTKDKKDEAVNKEKADNKNTGKCRKKKAQQFYISSAYADKFLLHVGDTITLKEKYEKEKYSFKIAGVLWLYGCLVCVYAPQ